MIRQNPFALSVACASKRSRSALTMVPFDFVAARLRSEPAPDLIRGRTVEMSPGLEPDRKPGDP